MPRMQPAPFVGALLVVVAAASLHGQQTPAQNPEADGFKFKSGVELINVTATVSDRSGRFVPNLTQDDFVLYEDDVRQTVTYFSAERVPVSLGIVLDNSGSMAGEKIVAARSAIERLAFNLLDSDDEIFLYMFNDHGILALDWTTDRTRLSRSLNRLSPNGGTAMYDALTAAIPEAARGRHPKKAIVIISDGNDTSSRRSAYEVKSQIRGSEILVYAIGIDGESRPTRGPSTRPQPRWPFPQPPPFPGPRMPGRGAPLLPQIVGPRNWGAQSDDRVNPAALRQLTDDSGGRTEIVRDTRDLDPATASIADELSRQYYLGYTSTGNRDGRWHSIRVTARDSAYRVRARTGYVAN